MPAVGDEPVIIRFSIMIGGAAIVLAVAFIVAALGLRAYVSWRDRKRETLEEGWLPFMLEALRGPVSEVPPLRRGERAHVLSIWNRLVASLSGEAVTRLQAFARTAQLDHAARQLLRRGRPAELLVATVFLGRQQDLPAVNSLRELLHTSEPVIRAEAARALVRVEPASGVRTVVPAIVGWEDCHPATAAAVLRDAPHDLVATALRRHVFADDEPVRQRRILEILGAVESPHAAEIARHVLARTIDPELIARCLQVLREQRDPVDAPLVRRFLRHATPFVRLHAVSTLARLRARGDEWRIVSMLDDPDWWVRHRAAEAVADSPRLDPRLVELMARIHPDRYARGALDHVLTERGT